MVERKKLKWMIEQRFYKDFNCFSLQLLEKAYPNGELLEKIIYPDNYDIENEGELLYPGWNSLFEAADEYLSDRLKQKVNELSTIGIYLMEVEETLAMMFIRGAGYDFYKQHWMPLYRDVLNIKFNYGINCQ